MTNHRRGLMTAKPITQAELQKQLWDAFEIVKCGRMNGNELPIIWLEDTDSMREYECIALSHVWSLTSLLKTALESMPKHQRAVPWNDFCIWLHETIILTMCLGITHLWADSLCIIQDSSQDWESESPRMRLIYSAATVVLCSQHINPNSSFTKRQSLT